MQTNSEFSNELDEESTRTSSNFKISTTHEEENAEQSADEDSDSEEFQPRIVQVTNFQQLNETQITSDKGIKQEMSSDIEQKNKGSRKITEIKNLENDDEESSDLEEDVSVALKTCKPSLFNKQPKRQWPWLIDNQPDAFEDETDDRIDNSTNAE